MEAITACNAPNAVAEAQAGAERLGRLRTDMVAGLTAAGFSVVDGAAPFVLFAVPDAGLARKYLQEKGIVVRRCDTFFGLPDGYLRAAVRSEWPVLVQALQEVSW